jgi:hypothetical protein
MARALVESVVVFAAGELAGFVFGAGDIVVLAAGEACGLGEGEGELLGAADTATGAQQATAAMHAVMRWDLFFMVQVGLGFPL